MKPRPSRLLLVLVLLCASAYAAEADRLKLDALTQEGDLLLDESAKLEPVSEKLAAESKALDEVEAGLRKDQPALGADIRKYNTDIASLEAEVAQLQARCPKKSTDIALVQACNTRAVQLNSEGQRLTEVREALNARNGELNQRIERLNRDRQDWSKRNQENKSRLGPNRTDVEEWLQRAGDYLVSPAFKSLYVASNTEPGTCGQEKLGDLKTLHYWEALRRVQGCFHAVRAGLPQ